jgi:hypothetical protein
MIINSNKTEVNVQVFAIQQAEIHKEKKGNLERSRKRSMGTEGARVNPCKSSDLRSRGQTKENV